ncbi:hypothetical protein V8E53_011286 [Lactarius tabidus]
MFPSESVVSDALPPAAPPPTLPATSPPESSPTVRVSSPLSPLPPSSARLPQRQYAPQPSVHIPSDPSPTRPTVSIASPALGGESFNGWDGAPGTFVNNASPPSVALQDDDDNGDDMGSLPAQTTPPSRKEIGL